MEDRQDDNTLGVIHEEHFVGESTRERASDDAMHMGLLLRMAQDRVECGIHTQKELGTESGDAFFIPVKRVCHLLFRFRSNDEPKAHLRLLMRSRTTPQGDPSSGF